MPTRKQERSIGRVQGFFVGGVLGVIVGVAAMAVR